jgi:SAM-dependent methyltransferase
MLQGLREYRGRLREDVPSVSLWDVYRFAHSLGMRSFDWRHLKSSLRLLIEPCNYWRNVEVPAVLDGLSVRPRQRILDIGSPKLPSIYIWYCLGAEVYATDLFPYFFEEYSHYKECLRPTSSGADFHIEQQDARQLGYADAFFDRVYALSVVEHIEEDGDSQAMREISRVLKPRGICCLTVPFASRYRESTIDHELYFKKPADGKPIFYERHYDPESLRSRLIEPSGLESLRTEYYGERWFAYERFCGLLPRSLRVMLSPFGWMCSKLFLCKLDPHSSSEAKTALLVLQKN